jgi:hypothetical protein
MARLLSEEVLAGQWLINRDGFPILLKYTVRNIDNHMANWKVIALISGNIEAVSGTAAQGRPGTHEWIVWEPLTARTVLRPSAKRERLLRDRSKWTGTNTALWDGNFASTKSVQLERSERAFQ